MSDAVFHRWLCEAPAALQAALNRRGLPRPQDWEDAVGEVIALAWAIYRGLPGGVDRPQRALGRAAWRYALGQRVSQPRQRQLPPRPVPLRFDPPAPPPPEDDPEPGLDPRLAAVMDRLGEREAQFLALLAGGATQAEAARAVGRSDGWGWWALRRAREAAKQVVAER